MKASQTITFLELLRDTVQTHGVAWTVQYLRKNLKMQQWELRFWMRQALR